MTTAEIRALMREAAEALYRHSLATEPGQSQQDHEHEDQQKSGPIVIHPQSAAA